jgi:hypothetical protein
MEIEIGPLYDEHGNELPVIITRQPGEKGGHIIRIKHKGETTFETRSLDINQGVTAVFLHATEAHEKGSYSCSGLD